MVYNAIQMREAIDKLIDRVKSPRFNDNNYFTAINRATDLIVKDRVENIKKKKNYSVQSSQRLRDELYTLVVPPSSMVPTTNITYPSDYYYLLSISASIDGIEAIVRPTTYNERDLLKRNPFKRPKTNKIYYLENATSIDLLIPSGSAVTALAMDYLKTPDVVSIGTETDKINPGAAVLVISSTYTVYDEAVHNGVTYYEGQSFLAVTTALTSGIVILTASIVDSNMPSQLHEDIIGGAAAIMNGTVEDWQKQQSLKIENSES